MLRNILLFFAVIIAGMIGIHTVLQNGSFLKYLDDHPDPRWVPPVEYVVGNGYYIFSDLQQSATYFVRIVERYPNSSYTDDAYFAYLQSLDDMGTVSRQDLIDDYTKYVERFPQGKHVITAKNRIDAYKVGS